ncbi:hypothetical protein LNI90_11510 [Tenacibaculum dicentrarchi]|nr:hypothetical protein [Tenacibaculum dicentrarchi]MCD8421228.1 hypothetical protein [Tenacibaculum dicentrarchi]MCD8438369.1 hypothetical protein [Tenacibaculum dicentrarchi]MCD8452709.1 hypothetical protein [Tenacibaculum dicentrarchi]MCG8828998.1 hypothetical protein [Tenacibaculum dicentrarchi]
MINEEKIKWNRIQRLKELKKLANSYLEENKKNKDSHKNSWEFCVVEKNIKELKKIIFNLNKELSTTKLNAYTQNQISSNKSSFLQNFDIQEHMNNMWFGSQKFEIMYYSPTFSIIHDLYWIEDGIVGEKIDVTLGKKSPDIYGKYLHDKLKLIECEIFPLLKSKKSLTDSQDIINTAITSIKKGNYSTGNILMITAIEGIIRKLCKHIYSLQNPNSSSKEVDNYIYSQFLSLEKLLTQGDFKPDFEISIIDGYILNKHVISEELEKFENLYIEFLKNNDWIKSNFDDLSTKSIEAIKNGDKEKAIKILLDFQEKTSLKPMNINEKVMISIKPRLQFLLRAYKEDRNLIIHGKYEEFNKKWKSYIYSSALCKVFDVIKSYPNFK